ncbi:MAG: thiamine pyrophosphate-dependent dehydrogenase E1 component subunit alpha [Agathobaculum sp.]|jgi:TPP-dependent pyruvate/acetoin dehydrogenase alpha subunit|uniref:thiamine pyrophosphate-dependent dehydrogenase E1 component subunit alpha n=1 Tax=Agathobaculum sp. TaxID=2048138 RepID=UPI003D8FF785
MEMTREKLLHLFEKMVQTRYFEETTERLNKEKKISGSIHTSVGEEATAVGVAAALGEGDYISASYRDLGCLFERGFEPIDIAGMLYAKACGATNGRTRVLHVGSLEKHILPANPILGASTAIAIGAALANKKDGNGLVTLNMFGDGASNEGAVHEAMNFAAVFNLPIVFVVKNNRYAWSTPTANIIPTTILADRAKAYGFPGYVANGNDVLDVYETVSRAVEDTRAGKGPALVECRTYRLSGHSGNDKNVYRTKNEVIRWLQDCPIRKLEGYITAAGFASQEEVDALRQRVLDKVDAAFAEACCAPDPDVETLLSERQMIC